MDGGKFLTFTHCHLLLIVTIDIALVQLTEEEAALVAAAEAVLEVEVAVVQGQLQVCFAVCSVGFTVIFCAND